MSLKNKNLLFCIPEIDHRQIARYEVEGLHKLGYGVFTTRYGGLKDKNPLLKLLIILKNSHSILQIAKRKKIDLIYINTAFNLKGLIRDFITLLIIRKTKAKIFLKTHGSDGPLLQTNNRFYKYIIKKYSVWADGFGVLSSDEYENFIKAGFSKKKLYIIKNIVNPAEYIINKDFKQVYDAKNKSVLLFAARLIPPKGLIDVIKAVIILIKKSFDIKLIVLGEGPERIKAEKLVTEADIKSYVVFTGFIPEEDTKVFYANADLLVFPTYHEEGFPMAVFQSVAAGLPMVTTKIRAAADYLKEPENCFWTEPKNPEMLAEKISYLLSNKSILNNISENNKYITNNFNQDTVCKELDLIFHKIF